MAFILDDILMSPLTLVQWIGDKLQETAETEITDETKVQEALLELQMRLELGEISEQKYAKKEKKLMERLEAIRKYKEGEGK
ncbi:MAG: gas vesicle protein GvpG [Candidatus Saganbacteria bacterium]|nr:gas vesicle protein GvpG [Candidatus Saganbacteria bacterium]